MYVNPTQPGLTVLLTTTPAKFPPPSLHVYTGFAKMASHNQEIEIKLAIEDIAALRGQLRKLRAKAAPRLFERNELYDTPQNDLRGSGRLLRIRIETLAPGKSTRPPGGTRANSRGVLTYKAPVEGIDPATPRRYKQREESEINFQAADRLEPILRALGFRAGFRYEKFRTGYTLPKLKGLHLDLDETPIGDYLELEGPPAAIDRAAKLLGFTAQNYITATYWDLYVAHCRGHRLDPSNLVFQNRKKSP
jgi:adenylate cyclase, class 2